MIKYKIKYVYDTGDSFHKEYDQVDYLKAIWINLDIAKENLRRIKEHYEYYLSINTYTYKFSSKN